MTKERVRGRRERTRKRERKEWTDSVCVREERKGESNE